MYFSVTSSANLAVLWNRRRRSSSFSSETDTDRENRSAQGRERACVLFVFCCFFFPYALSFAYLQI